MADRSVGRHDKKPSPSLHPRPEIDIFEVAQAEHRIETADPLEPGSTKHPTGS